MKGKYSLFISRVAGSHLLSHIVSNVVPSAARGLTVVFGMGTGVPLARIATGWVRCPLTAQQQPKPLVWVFAALALWKCLHFHTARYSRKNTYSLLCSILRKEVIQPHLPIRLPCYDFTPVTGSAFDGSL